MAMCLRVPRSLFNKGQWSGPEGVLLMTWLAIKNISLTSVLPQGKTMQIVVVQPGLYVCNSYGYY